MNINNFTDKKDPIAVIGLGYVGLPLALSLAKKFKVIGFDVSENRVALMKKGIDPSEELTKEAFENKNITFTAQPKDLKSAKFYIIAVLGGHSLHC